MPSNKHPVCILKVVPQIFRFPTDIAFVSGKFVFDFVTSATGMTKISMKNSKCAMSKQKKKDFRPSRYKKHERKKKARGERAEKRARVEKLQKKMKNCQKMKKDQQKDYRNVVSSPWESNNICRILPGAKYG